MAAARVPRPRQALSVTAESLAEARREMLAALRGVARLRDLLPPLPFTADGHLVGSFGEAWAVWMFDLEHLPEKVHDARAKSGVGVQIKATFGGTRVGMAPHGAPDRLIVINLDDECRPTIVYNGPGGRPWELARAGASGGQRFISVRELVRLDQDVDASYRLACVRDPADVA